MHSHPEIALKEQSGLNMRMIEGRQYGCLHVVFWTPGFSTLQGQIEESDPEIIPKRQLRDHSFSPSDSAEGGSNLSVMLA